MKKEDVILIAEDDESHFELIRKNLLRAGIYNEMIHLTDGQKVLDFLFGTDKATEGERSNQEYVLLLDISIPRVDGVEVLKKIKQDAEAKRIPVIILTSTDDPSIIEQCYGLGCSTYIVKSTMDNDFQETIQTIGHFLSVVEITPIR